MTWDEQAFVGEVVDDGHGAIIGRKQSAKEQDNTHQTHEQHVPCG